MIRSWTTSPLIWSKTEKNKIKTDQCVNPHMTSSMFIRLKRESHYKTHSPSLKWLIFKKLHDIILHFNEQKKVQLYCSCFCLYDEKRKYTTPHRSHHGTLSFRWESGWSPMVRPSHPQQSCPQHAAAEQSTCVPRTCRHIQTPVRLLEKWLLVGRLYTHVLRYTDLPPQTYFLTNITPATMLSSKTTMTIITIRGVLEEVFCTCKSGKKKTNLQQV